VIAIVTTVVHSIFYAPQFIVIFLSLTLAYACVLMLMKKVNKEATTQKTLLAASYSEPSNPTSLVHEDMNLTKALEYIKELNQSQQEVKVTMTHLMGHALGIGLKKIENQVGRIRWGYFKKSEKLGITCLVDVDGGSDLVPITVWDAHDLTLIEFAKRCTDRVNKAKNKQDAAHNQTTAAGNFVPSHILQPIMLLLSYINICLDLPIPPLGVKRNTHGHYILTNVGTMGMECGIAPLCPPMRAIGLTCCGAMKKTPVVVDGEVKIQQVMKTVSTADHRFGDAASFLPLQRAV
jgi:pyruvate dehydrogenase E2 component (dihydrolipoamide acetyltransferase)